MDVGNTALCFMAATCCICGKKSNSTEFTFNLVQIFTGFKHTVTYYDRISTGDNETECQGKTAGIHGLLLNEHWLQAAVIE